MENYKGFRQLNEIFDSTEPYQIHYDTKFRKLYTFSDGDQTLAVVAYKKVGSKLIVQDPNTIAVSVMRVSANGKTTRFKSFRKPTQSISTIVNIISDTLDGKHGFYYGMLVSFPGIGKYDRAGLLSRILRKKQPNYQVDDSVFVSKTYKNTLYTIYRKSFSAEYVFKKTIRKNRKSKNVEVVDLTLDRSFPIPTEQIEIDFVEPLPEKIDIKQISGFATDSKELSDFLDKVPPPTFTESDHDKITTDSKVALDTVEDLNVEVSDFLAIEVKKFESGDVAHHDIVEAARLSSTFHYAYDKIMREHRINGTITYSEETINAVEYYGGTGYTPINKFLLKGEIKDYTDINRIEKSITALDDSFKRDGNYFKSPTPLYRGMRIGINDADKVVSHSHFYNRSFVSTSFSPSVAYSFATNNLVNEAFAHDFKYNADKISKPYSNVLGRYDKYDRMLIDKYNTYDWEKYRALIFMRVVNNSDAIPSIQFTGSLSNWEQEILYPRGMVQKTTNVKFEGFIPCEKYYTSYDRELLGDYYRDFRDDIDNGNLSPNNAIDILIRQRKGYIGRLLYIQFGLPIFFIDVEIVSPSEITTISESKNGPVKGAGETPDDMFKLIKIANNEEPKAETDPKTGEVKVRNPGKFMTEV